MRLDVWPVALVLVLLLRPHDLGVRVLLDLLGDQIPRERVQLLDSRDRHLVVQVTGRALLVQLIVDLATAQNQTLHLLRVLASPRRVRNDALERGVLGHLAEVGLRVRVSEQRFRREHNQRLSERQNALSSQHVEVVRRCAAVHHNHVRVVQLLHVEAFVDLRVHVRVAVGQLQESLRSR